jgi:hypothetical protein
MQRVLPELPDAPSTTQAEYPVKTAEETEEQPLKQEPKKRIQISE